MAKEYLERLSKLIEQVALSQSSYVKLEVKHFFSGAAVYVNEKIFMTLTPVGLAIKLPEKNIEKLLKEGKAKKLRYFPKAPIKKDYAILSKELTDDLKILRYYIKMSIKNFIKEEIKKE